MLLVLQQRGDQGEERLQSTPRMEREEREREREATLPVVPLVCTCIKPPHELLTHFVCVAVCMSGCRPVTAGVSGLGPMDLRSASFRRRRAACCRLESCAHCSKRMRVCIDLSTMWGPCMRPHSHIHPGDTAAPRRARGRPGQGRRRFDSGIR
eukprot:7381986-Prymnesium_polylepis.1